MNQQQFHFQFEETLSDFTSIESPENAISSCKKLLKLLEEQSESENAEILSQNISSIIREPNLLSLIRYELKFCHFGKGEDASEHLYFFAKLLFMLTTNCDQVCEQVKENGTLTTVFEILQVQLNNQVTDRIEENAIIFLILSVCKILEVVLDAKQIFFEMKCQNQVAEIVSSSEESSNMKVFTLLLLSIAADSDENKSKVVFNEHLPVITILINKLEETVQNSRQFWIEHVATSLTKKPAYRAGFLKALLTFSRTEQNSNLLVQQTTLLKNLPQIFDMKLEYISYPAAELVWELSFSKPNRKLICENEELMNQIKVGTN